MSNGNGIQRISQRQRHSKKSVTVAVVDEDEKITKSPMFPRSHKLKPQSQTQSIPQSSSSPLLSKARVLFARRRVFHHQKSKHGHEDATDSHPTPPPKNSEKVAPSKTASGAATNTATGSTTAGSSGTTISTIRTNHTKKSKHRTEQSSSSIPRSVKQNNHDNDQGIAMTRTNQSHGTINMKATLNQTKSIISKIEVLQQQLQQHPRLSPDTVHTKKLPLGCTKARLSSMSSPSPILWPDDEPPQENEGKGSTEEETHIEVKWEETNSQHKKSMKNLTSPYVTKRSNSIMVLPTSCEEEEEEEVVTTGEDDRVEKNLATTLNERSRIRSLPVQLERQKVDKTVSSQHDVPPVVVPLIYLQRHSIWTQIVRELKHNNRNNNNNSKSNYALLPSQQKQYQTLDPAVVENLALPSFDDVYEEEDQVHAFTHSAIVSSVSLPHTSTTPRKKHVHWGTIKELGKRRYQKSDCSVHSFPTVSTNSTEEEEDEETESTESYSLLDDEDADVDDDSESMSTAFVTVGRQGRQQ